MMACRGNLQPVGSEPQDRVGISVRQLKNLQTDISDQTQNILNESSASNLRSPDPQWFIHSCVTNKAQSRNIISEASMFLR
jgi:hypothetical protein